MALTPSANKLKPGSGAPNFQLKGIDEKTYTLHSFKHHKGIVLIFMCNHCPFVIQKLDALKDLQDFCKGQDIALVGINSNDTVQYPDDNFENMKKFAKDNDLHFLYLFDESQQVAKAYGATCTPDPFLLTSDGKVFFHGRINNQLQLGEQPTEDTLKEAIKAMLAKTQLEKDFDPSMGCNIKWKK